MGPGPLGGGMNSSSDNCHPMLESVAKFGIAASFAAPRAFTVGHSAAPQTSAPSKPPMNRPDSTELFLAMEISLLWSPSAQKSGFAAVGTGSMS